MMTLIKNKTNRSVWAPLEEGIIRFVGQDVARVTVTDGAGNNYVSADDTIRFKVRGALGIHTVRGYTTDGECIVARKFRVGAATHFDCEHAPYNHLFRTMEAYFLSNSHQQYLTIDDKRYRMNCGWSRDNTHILKSAIYFERDVQSSLELWLDTQKENGMFIDCFHKNHSKAPNWFAEALGEGWFSYYNDMSLIGRRIPVEADVEYCIAEGVYHAWKASGDDVWMATQLPKLEKALVYNTTDPLRWSTMNQLVKRSFCMDNWDFVNPHYCNGDHRCIHEGDPQFLFHGDNSGLYSFYRMLGEMYETLGDVSRATELRVEGEALRERANRKLFFGGCYGHMIPDELPEEEVYALVGDERSRMSLSTGYTINRKLPNHEMAVKILEEYQRRRAANRQNSFAEWWTMDPAYTPDQWDQDNEQQGPASGEYMNGGICHISSGELAKAAFDHGMETYGADILNRVWKLTERDEGEITAVYKRLPSGATMAPAQFTPISLKSVANRGLKNAAFPCVIAWTNEGDNDLRNLPVGTQSFGAIEFEVMDPAENDGKAILYLDGRDHAVTIAVQNQQAESLYFMHAEAGGLPHATPVAIYTVNYSDGTSIPVYIRNGYELNNWWGATDVAQSRGNGSVDRATTRLAWLGENPTWKTTGTFMFGWNNPHPKKAIQSIQINPEPLKALPNDGLLLCAISASDRPVEFELDIRSYGLPALWAISSVFHGMMSGLCGVEDKGRSFDSVEIAPRFAATAADRAAVTLHYPASNGYCSYEYHYDHIQGIIELDVTGSFETARIHLLLPHGKSVASVHCGDLAVSFDLQTVEESLYADICLTQPPAQQMIVVLRDE